MNRRLLSLGALAGALGWGAGCGRPHADAHAGHGHSVSATAESVPTQATFKAGTGLILPPEIRTAIGLATAAVEERIVPPTLRIRAQVIAAGPPAFATASVSAVQAAFVANQTLTGARLVKVAPHTPAPDSPVDLVLALDGNSSAGPGDDVDLTFRAAAAPPVPSIPRSALLRSAGGTFAYVVNGGAYLRTAVVVGAESADHLEVVEGLYAGDEVVTHPVEQLWLIELRATKGGGHSH